MIARTLTLAAGFGGAVALSQFPEVSQQYVQRLGGAVDALAEVVADFDASAAAAGLTRGEALAQMAGSDFVERRRADMEATFDRYARLQAELGELRGAGPFMRAYHVAQADGDIARAALAEFKPAMPLTLAGGIFALVGFIVGSALVSVVTGVLRRPKAVQP